MADLVTMVGNIIELAKLHGKSADKSAVVFTNFKELALDHGGAEAYDKASTAVIVAAGVKRSLWTAGEWKASPINSVFCWTKEGHTPHPIGLRTKKLPDGTPVENKTSTDVTHKNCVTYAGAIKKFLACGGTVTQLQEMGWSELIEHNKAFNSDGSAKTERDAPSPLLQVEKALQVVKAHALALGAGERMAYRVQFAEALS